jgi:dTDP-glucose 4,6-dehydratase
MQRNILITGSAGFIGSNFIKYFLDNYKEYKLVSLDLLTYAADIKNIKDLSKYNAHTFIKGDICDRYLINKIFIDYEITDVIHFAAETHVDNSIVSPDIFIKTNILGTYTLIDVAKDLWLKKPFEYNEKYRKEIKKNQFFEPRFHYVSTDEVYGSIDKSSQSATENSKYSPSSPYSASKAASDMIVESYNKTYGLNTLITHCSNNFGANQNDEKFIPVVVESALNWKKIPIYGNGQNIRDWLYVEDHCIGLDKAFHLGKKGDSYNLSSGNELTNLQLVEKICTLLDKLIPKKGRSYKELISFVDDRYGHDMRYSLDSSKARKVLGWSPVYEFDTALEKTICEYMDRYNECKKN